jgi:hypothetical protein
MFRVEQSCKIRNPITEIRMKSEYRNPKLRIRQRVATGNFSLPMCMGACEWQIRYSDFGIVSAFGFRVSDLSVLAYASKTL